MSYQSICLSYFKSDSRTTYIDKINNIVRCNLIDTKYHQMGFRSARWRCSHALFGNPWSMKSEWWPQKGDNLWNLFFSSRIKQRKGNTSADLSSTNIFKLAAATAQLLNVWVKKTETIHSSVISHSSKSIWVIKLSFCQNDPPMGELFWQKDSLITHILFELCLFRNIVDHCWVYKSYL